MRSRPDLAARAVDQLFDLLSEHASIAYRLRSTVALCEIGEVERGWASSAPHHVIPGDEELAEPRFPWHEWR